LEVGADLLDAGVLVALALVVDRPAERRRPRCGEVAPKPDVGRWIAVGSPPRVDASIESRIAQRVRVRAHDTRVGVAVVVERRVKEAVGEDRIAEPRLGIPRVVERGMDGERWL